MDCSEKNIEYSAMALKDLACTKENMKFIVDDANQIDLWFEDGEVDRIHLNFLIPGLKSS